MKLDSNSHSVFKLHYPLVLTIKYKRKVIHDDISNRLHYIFAYIGKKYNITTMEWNHDQDHIHVLFLAHRNSSLSIFLNAYKLASSRRIKKEFPEVRKFLWIECFWSKSFGLLTTGGATLEIIKKYIQTQGGEK